jgi:hypothetical protein
MFVCSVQTGAHTNCCFILICDAGTTRVCHSVSSTCYHVERQRGLEGASQNMADTIRFMPLKRSSFLFCVASQVVWLRNGSVYVKKTMPSAIFTSAMLVQVGKSVSLPCLARMCKWVFYFEFRFVIRAVSCSQDFEIEVIMMREFRCPNLVRYFDGTAVAKRREAFIVRIII